jgi:hypothetical protein
MDRKASVYVSDVGGGGSRKWWRRGAYIEQAMHTVRIFKRNLDGRLVRKMFHRKCAPISALQLCRTLVCGSYILIK